MGFARLKLAVEMLSLLSVIGEAAINAMEGNERVVSREAGMWRMMIRPCDTRAFNEVFGHHNC